MAVISQKMQDAINKQINAELYSSYLYLSMSAWAMSENLKGSAQWLRVQSEEENGHAMKLFDFLLDRGGKIKLEEIRTPSDSWKGLEDCFKDVYAHELKVTQMIHDLVRTAQEEKDIASQVFLQWFVTEQVEEEANALEIVDTFKLIGDSKGSLYMLDRKLGKRKEG
jgi:ferritin